MPHGNNSPRTAFTLVELLVVIAIIGILIALLLPAVQAAREAARRAQCSNNLKQITLAMHNYHAATKVLPPGSIISNNLAWNVMILPYIEQQPLYDLFDFREGPFNGGSNREGPNKSIHALNRVEAFLCPSATRLYATHPSSTLLNPERKTYASHYFGVAGPKGPNPFGGTYLVERESNGYGGFALDGVLFKNSAIRIGDVIDGTSNTLAVGEIAWPRGGTYGSQDGGTDGGGDGANWVRGIAFGTTDAQISGSSSCKNVVDGINVLPTLFNDISFSSKHPGGAQFGMCDGSVRFVSENVDLLVYKSTASRDGGEVKILDQ